jgi:hypothetical protein
VKSPDFANNLLSVITIAVMRKPESSGLIHDYNGEGRWSVSSVQDRYVEYCRQYGVQEPKVPTPREHREGQSRWAYPVMEAVIEGIERGDKASIAIGLILSRRMRVSHLARH